ncbi:MAG: HGGxSTG domain-containing protein [Pseudomonadota bacterium]
MSQRTARAASPRCGARTRAGTPCRLPPVRGRPRCRMHGCAPGAGGQKGNKNALKHGYYTKRAVEDRKMLVKLTRLWGLKTGPEG